MQAVADFDVPMRSWGSRRARPAEQRPETCDELDETLYFRL
jgi:hypothetical protein